MNIALINFIQFMVRLFNYSGNFIDSIISAQAYIILQCIMMMSTYFNVGTISDGFEKKIKHVELRSSENHKSSVSSLG